MKKRAKVSLLPAILHTTLFSYQKAMKECLGAGATVMIPHILELLGGVPDEAVKEFMNSKSMEEGLEKLSKILKDARVAEKVSIERMDDEQYLLKIEDYVFADSVHKLLKPKDVTCPFAIVMMALFEKVHSKKVKINESLYTDTGTETVIKARLVLKE
jgi:hypothetical protein